MSKRKFDAYCVEEKNEDVSKRSKQEDEEINININNIENKDKEEDELDDNDICNDCYDKENNCDCSVCNLIESVCSCCDSSSDDEIHEDTKIYDKEKQYRFQAEEYIYRACQAYLNMVKGDLLRKGQESKFKKINVKFQRRARWIIYVYFDEIYANLNCSEDNCLKEDVEILSNVMEADYNFLEHFDFMGQISNEYEMYWESKFTWKPLPLPCLRCSKIEPNANVRYIFHPNNQCLGRSGRKDSVLDEEFNCTNTSFLFHDMIELVKVIWFLWFPDINEAEEKEEDEEDQNEIENNYIQWIPEEVIENILFFIVQKDEKYFKILNWEERGSLTESSDSDASYCSPDEEEDDDDDDEDEDEDDDEDDDNDDNDDEDEKKQEQEQEKEQDE
jgi:hypothetical protein